MSSKLFNNEKLNELPKPILTYIYKCFVKEDRKQELKKFKEINKAFRIGNGSEEERNIIKAINNNYFSCISSFINPSILNNTYIEIVSNAGNAKALRWIIKYLKLSIIFSYLIKNAIVNGNLTFIRCAERLGFNAFSYDFIDIICKKGWLECLKYGLETGRIERGNNIYIRLGFTVVNRDIKLLKYFCEELKFPILPHVIRYTARVGTIEVFRYLHGEGYRLGKDEIIIAKNFSNLECLKYLLEYAKKEEIENEYNLSEIKEIFYSSENTEIKEIINNFEKNNSS